MTIDRLGSVDPVSKYNKAGKANRPVKKENTDSISFSEKAKNMGEIYKATELVKNSPDIRMDRVEEVKRKLEDPNYISDEVIDSLADKILEMFKI